MYEHDLDSDRDAEEACIWPTLLPDAVVQHLLLPQVQDCWPALRLTCRTLRDRVNAQLTAVKLTSPLEQLNLRSLPRLPNLGSLTIRDAQDEDVVFIAGALRRLTQLTSLVIHLKTIHLSSNDDDAPKKPLAPIGAYALAAHLTRLQRLEEFDCSPKDRNVFGAATGRVVAALARLPALRNLKVSPEMTVEMLSQPIDELGVDNAWRSLQRLALHGWTTESIRQLSHIQLPRLKHLILESPTVEPGDYLGAIISGAFWAPQLECLAFEKCSQLTLNLLSDLRLPNLLLLVAMGRSSYQETSRFSVTGMRLPRLQYLFVSPDAFGDVACPSLASVDLPSLTSLTILNGHISANDLSALITASPPWLRQLESLELLTHVSSATRACRRVCEALAAAPLSKLRRLKWSSCEWVDRQAAAAIGHAPWLRGLEEASFEGFSEEALQALRAGGGGFKELEAAGRVELLQTHVEDSHPALIVYDDE